MGNGSDNRRSTEAADRKSRARLNAKILAALKSRHRHLCATLRIKPESESGKELLRQLRQGADIRVLTERGE